MSGFTLVSGTIKDAAGNLYSNARIFASFVGQNTTPGAGPYLLNGLPSGQFPTVLAEQADSFGAFAMPLADNNQVQPTPSQWSFSVVSSDGTKSFNTLITITGVSQDITSLLQAAAAPFVTTTSFPLLSLGETTPPPGAVGRDVIYGDSAAHRLKVINNNGSPVQLVQAGVDINTSDQVTVTHLATSLPVVQGGTGVAAAQGNGTKVQLSTGGTNVNDVVIYDANGNAITSGKSIPGGVIVGDTDNQILKNKTLITAGSGNLITLLNTQGPLAPIVGTGADATVYSFTIPANTIQAGKGFRVQVVGFHSTGANAVTYKLTIGATNLISTSASDGSTQNWNFSVFNQPGVQNSQYYEGVTEDGLSIIVNTFGTTAENFANAITVKFTFAVAATDQYTGKVFVVELIQ